ncbi:MAG: NUDIX domain-containing protein [Patescibacteria group bacterium]
MAQGTPELIDGLKKIDPLQPYGTEFFNALAKLTVSVAVEAVCLRLQRYLPEIDATTLMEIQVYLVQRSPDDTAYPGEWHCPGSIMRPGESFEDVLRRLSEKEFGANLVSTRFVANINPSKLEPEVRGTFLSVVYLCVFEEKEGLRGKWFPVNNLPEKTVKCHRERIIPCALGAFLADNPNI